MMIEPGWVSSRHAFALFVGAAVAITAGVFLLLLR
jgi:hypothetical protein